MLCCLIAAALWAVSLSLYRGPIRDLGPIAVDFFKCSVAAALYALWISASGAAIGGAPREWASLALSGVLGFTIGDLLLFISVREGGLQRALVLFNTSPLLAALAAIPLLGELPGPRAWAGLVLVLVGVTLVETDPRRAGRQAGGAHPRPWLATLAGLGAAAGQAGGVVFSRQPLQVMDVLPATFTRLAAAAVTLAPLLALAPARQRLGALAPRRWRRLALPTLLGTVVALLFAMRGVQQTGAGAAAALLATTPIFALPLARFALKEPIGRRSVVGTLVAVGGVALLG